MDIDIDIDVSYSLTHNLIDMLHLLHRGPVSHVAFANGPCNISGVVSPLSGQFDALKKFANTGVKKINDRRNALSE